MKTTSVNEKERQKQLLKKFHTLCTVAGIKQEQKDIILSAYGVESSRDLTINQLIDIINKLESEPDQWRKRVIASVGAWLRATNRDENIELIKGIACRASGYSDFNRIPLSRLRDIYYAFTKQAKTSVMVQTIVKEQIDLLTLKN